VRNLVFALVLGWTAGAGAGEHGDDTPQEPPSKSPVKKKEPAPPAFIKDPEAIKYVQQRLEAQTGVRGWKIDLKETVGTSKDFTATAGDRTEKGSVNVVKNYPNQGIHRVYVSPKD
jgi:hypothetical protein